jgi:hypothetical protein
MIGTRAATSVFLYSFSGGQEKGAHMGEVKRSATTLENPSSVVAEGVEQLKSKLFYLQSQNDKYFFSNQANLNRILVTKMENIKPELLTDSEKQLLKQQIAGDKLKVFLWPDKPKDVLDSEQLKLVITSGRNGSFMKKVIEMKGEGFPRINVNTVLFLSAADSERPSFSDALKRKIAYEQIETDKTVNLTNEQRKELGKNLSREIDNLQDAVRRLYRLVYVPSKDGIKEIDMRIPTYGEKRTLDQDVYERLRQEGEVLEKIAPLVIMEKYLKDKDHVKLRQIHDSMLKTPGERRVVNPSTLEEGIRLGVKQGFFGLGEMQEDGSINCRFFREEPTVSFSDSEVLIKDSVCLAQRQMPQPTAEPAPTAGEAGVKWSRPSEISAKLMSELELKFKVPRGKISQIMGVMNYLQSKFQSLEMEIRAREGSLSEDDYANKIREALKQLGIEIEET